MLLLNDQESWSLPDIIGVLQPIYPKQKWPSHFTAPLFLTKLIALTQKSGTRDFLLANTTGFGYRFENHRAIETLNLKYRKREECFKDTMEDLIKWEFIKLRV